jgi:hypothetical protein
MKTYKRGEKTIKLPKRGKTYSKEVKVEEPKPETKVPARTKNRAAN